MNAAMAIITSQSWLSLATVDADGFPHASYVPYAVLPGGLAIVVSRLAPHAIDLRCRPHASALIVGCRPTRDNPCAGARLAIDIVARPASPRALGERIWAALEARHGNLVRTFRGLPDFAPMMLEPVRSRLVFGFASTQYIDESRIAQTSAIVNPN
jgi:putative heme iron utilization protein